MVKMVNWVSRDPSVSFLRRKRVTMDTQRAGDGCLNLDFNICGHTSRPFRDADRLNMSFIVKEGRSLPQSSAYLCSHFIVSQPGSSLKPHTILGSSSSTHLRQASDSPTTALNSHLSPTCTSLPQGQIPRHLNGKHIVALSYKCSKMSKCEP